MFAPSTPVRPLVTGRDSGRAPAGPHRLLTCGAILRLAFLILPLTATPAGGASAQALGTMQVTARVLPGLAPWAGVLEAQALAEQVRGAPFPGSEIRRAVLVHARAEVASTAGRRRLLITVDYPRN